MKKRIWELDALRGIAVLGFIAIHIAFDLIVLYRIWQPESTALFDFGQDWGGVAFLLISGICVTLGSRCCRRGLLVFGCGIVISAVTAGMYFLGFADRSIIIYFGVLHCLGVCMLLWPVFRKSPAWLLLSLGILLSALGLYFKFSYIATSSPWLTVLGIPHYGFASSDYFPLLPNLGYFLIGAFLGRTVYRKQQTLLPMVNENFFILRFLRFCGRHSLLIYMLHQPLIAGAISLYLMF